MKTFQEYLSESFTDVIQSKKSYATPKAAEEAAKKDGKKFVDTEKLPSGKFVYTHEITGQKDK